MDCKVCDKQDIPLIQHKVYKCNDCGHIFINYTEDGLLYHKKLYRKPNQEGNRGNNEVENGIFTPEFHKRRDGICTRRIDKIKELLLSGNSLLDIGAGGGTFVNKAKDFITDVEVQEVSDLCADNLRIQNYKVYHGPFNELSIDRTYELVTCWHVLEHIEDLKGYVSNLIKVSSRYVVIEVPINRRLRNPDRDFDGHFHYFSKDSIKKLFESHFNFLYLGEGIQNPALLCILQKK